MKSLHKKLSAMLLAGVVVIGGVVGSGVSSFAAQSKVAKANIKQESYQDRRVKSVVKGAGGEVLEVSKDGGEIDKVVKSKYKDYSGKKYLKRGGEVKNACSIPVNFNQFRRSGRELVKIKCQDSYYLIKLNQ